MATEMLDVLMVGTGEYTTGYVDGAQSTSDKKVGVVGLVCFDLRRRGKIGNISMAGTNGAKFAGIKSHFKGHIADVYNGLDCSFRGYPRSGAREPEAYREAIDALPKGSAITIFTPDPTHFPIALYALKRGMHVLVTKPAVKTLKEHQILTEAARRSGCVVLVEHHKRFDPAYADAIAKARSLGAPNFFSSYMSQPKSQLSTFKSWAGKDSDISYYLNSHHIDIHSCIMAGKATPTKVTASGSTGVATSEPYSCVEGTEDTITLLTEWTSVDDPKRKSIAVYTASWTAPLKAGVHSEQTFHMMLEKGEVRVDQARRGYTVTNDETGMSSINPFYMKYSPDELGNFDGQHGYGYISIEKFIDACAAVNAGTVKFPELDARGLPTIRNVEVTTAILEAGRISLDERRSVEITFQGGVWGLK